MWLEGIESPISRVDGDDPLVYTMRELDQRMASIISEIETTGKPAYVTRHGRFVAMITPLAPGQVESRVLAEMAREIGEPTATGPRPPGTNARRPSGSPSLNPPIGTSAANARVSLFYQIRVRSWSSR